MQTTEQAIVDAFVTLMGNVTGIRGAYDGRVTTFSDPELPAANVFTPESDTDSSGSLFDHELKLSIVLHVAERTAQKVIRALAGDVYAAIGKAYTDSLAAGTPLLGLPQIIEISNPSKVVKCAQQGDFVGSAQIALTVTYRTARWAV